MSGTLGVRQPDGKKGIHVCVCVCLCVCVCVCVREGERERERARGQKCAHWGGVGRTRGGESRQRNSYAKRPRRLQTFTYNYCRFRETAR